jgi:hypothetical protein
MFTLEEAQEFLDLLLAEVLYNGKYSCRYAVLFILAIYTGFRRGELLGLEWKDFNNGLVSVRRAAYYSPAKGNYTDTPKTSASFQTQRLPTPVWQLVQAYRVFQEEYASSLGSKWVSTDRLFALFAVYSITAEHAYSVCTASLRDICHRRCSFLNDAVYPVRTYYGDILRFARYNHG